MGLETSDLYIQLKTYKNSKKQGDAGLGTAIGWFSSNGYTG